MSKKKKKVKGSLEEKNEEHKHDYLVKQLVDNDGNAIVDLDRDMQALGELLIDNLNSVADLSGHPIEALDEAIKKSEALFEWADYCFELASIDEERKMIKVRFLIDDWIDKEEAQRLIAKIQSE